MHALLLSFEFGETWLCGVLPDPVQHRKDEPLPSLHPEEMYRCAGLAAVVLSRVKGELY